MENLPKRLAKSAVRALNKAGFASLEKLVDISEAELLKLHGMGPKALEQIKAALAEKGLSLKQ